MLIVGGNQSVGGYDVDNSLRFDKVSTDYLNRTFSTPTSTQKCTYSGWIKRSKLTDAGGQYFLTYFGDFSNAMYFNGAGTGLGSNDQFVLYCDPTIRLYTNRLFRDPSAWYHIVVAIDTTQSTASDRVKLYVNGVQETSFATETYPSQNGNLTGLFGATGSTHDIGRGKATGVTEYFGGYMSEVVFIDGLQLDPTSFGEFDEDSGIWKPINVSGLTFGTNGFYLDFEDSAALGDDISGNNNDFSVNNLTSNDQMPDTCTNNWCTINPLHEVNATNLAEGNLQYSAPGGGVAQYMGTMGMSTGSWYYEFRPRSGTVDYQIGIAEAPATPPGGNDYQRWTYKNNGRLEFAGGSTSGWGSTYTNGDVIGISMDVDNGIFKAYKNGTLSGTKTGLDTDITWLPHFVGYGGPTVDVNFGQDSTFAGATTAGGNTDAAGYGDFKQSVPADHYALNTKNLAEYG